MVMRELGRTADARHRPFRQSQPKRETTVSMSLRRSSHPHASPGKPAHGQGVAGPCRGASFWLAFIAVFAGSVGGAHAEGKAVKIDNIRAHLFYEHMGRLSKSIALPTSFSGFNTMIGEGDAEEPAQDLLIVVELSGPKNAYIKRPLTIIVSHPGGNRPSSKREFKEGLSFGESGKIAKALYVENATCSPLRAAASIGASTKQIVIDFRCGE